MRELKFRVWDTKNKAFIDGIPPREYMLDADEWDHRDCDEDDPRYFVNYVLSLNFKNRLIFQQYAGIKDKNGKEIYEGDIVSVIDDNNIFVVKFGKVNRNIVGFDTNTIFPVELNTFYFESEGRPYFSITKNSFGKHDLEDTIVIGNIFENKNLLE